jgi:hypothetical protein
LHIRNCRHAKLSFHPTEDGPRLYVLSKLQLQAIFISRDLEVEYMLDGSKMAPECIIRNSQGCEVRNDAEPQNTFQAKHKLIPVTGISTYAWLR